jgi:mRNA interferase RelE/StbE
LASRVRYKASVEKDLQKLSSGDVKRILNKLERELLADPGAGEPLKGKFKGLRRLSVGDYRVIFARTTDGVLVLRISHRKEADEGKSPAE